MSLAHNVRGKIEENGSGFTPVFYPVFWGHSEKKNEVKYPSMDSTFAPCTAVHEEEEEEEDVERCRTIELSTHSSLVLVSFLN